MHPISGILIFLMYFAGSSQKLASNMKKLLLISVSFCITCALFAQAKGKYSASGWQLMDPSADSVYVTSVPKAYNEFPKGKKSHNVIFAVIDAGIDTAHEDLKG